MVIVLMGVAGSGKTTVGRLLADALGWRFADADQFHSAANIRKMSAGEPLDDADRAPWLAAIRTHIDTCLATAVSSIVTCSALKQKYRDQLGLQRPGVKLVYLKGTRDILSSRISARTAHFMKPDMLDSQLAELEEPTAAVVATIDAPPEQIAAAIRRALAL